MSKNTLIELQDVSRYFGSRVVLKNIQLSIGVGEHTLLTGDNGAGKTTLLRIMASLLKPSKGSLVLFGQNDLLPLSDQRKKLGIMLDQSFLFADMTVEENLLFYGHLYGLQLAQSDLSENLESFRLQHLRHSLAGTLSKGEQRKVSIVRSMIHKPRLVLWDEPSSGLDTHSQVRLVDFMRDHSGHTTFVVVSHEQHIYEPMISRQLVLESGRLR